MTPPSADPAPVTVETASDSDKEWAAAQMAASDPWMRLGRTLEHCRNRCFDRETEVFIDRRNGRPCGFLLIHPRGLAGSPYIAAIGVAPEARGRGIGSTLMHFAEQRYRGKSRFLFLCVSSFNLRARSLYERLGFEKVGELNDYVVEGTAEILMRKRLGNG